MKRKIGTLIEEDLLVRAKKFSAGRGIPLNELLELSLEGYLEQQSEQGLLTLDEILDAEPGSHSSEGLGRGA